MTRSESWEWLQLAAGKGGEDALFVSEALWGAIGVADGVGSWSQDGIDTSLYSRYISILKGCARCQQSQTACTALETQPSHPGHHS